MQNLQEILPWLEQPLFFELNPFTQFAGGGEGGVKVLPEKTPPHLKKQFPPEMTLLKCHQNFENHPKSNFLFTPISSICFKKFSR